MCLVADCDGASSINSHVLPPAGRNPMIRQHLLAFVTSGLRRLGLRFLAWSRPRNSDENSFQPDCLQVDMEFRRVREELDTEIDLYNVCVDDYNRKLRIHHAEVYQDGARHDAVHVSVSEDGRGFIVRRPVLSPAQLQRGRGLSMERLNLAMCRHYLEGKEAGLEEMAIENTIKKIVAEQI